ncbi:RusA family crossover junction endodeoxyribonuclease [Prescottella equi]|uniref:RusA family crossover junction endodeoxyribonuclease n=1 Tax=Rhodococcus hoagii TaxID=43767 RepID=UPI001C74807A|nr:RusA family crossover junction endodeoxyribonuclease [Prescottella equi]BCN51610.1 hypothetical protein RE9416_49110 [Prescottella equi]BCN56630.1 hypothetical protein RE9425_50200 [Prescottella equi]BCN61545.1 hypothetical protein RE9427_49150 [Prescottella equi]BCN86348.1 hypothetical protein RE0356_49890 [Prescottella equi]
MTHIGPHPIDLELATMPEAATAEERLEVVWKHYEQETQHRLDRPVPPDQQQEVHHWLVHQDLPILVTKRAVLHVEAAPDIVRKASLVTQHACHACEFDNGSSPGPPVNISFPIRVMPWSAQSNSNTNQKLKAAVTAELKTRGLLQGVAGSRPMCISISAIVPPKQKKKDVDNLVKGLLDSLTSVLYNDDRHVQCLTTRRFEHSGTEGYYLVKARTVRPWDADVVWPDSTKDPVFPGQEAIVVS